MTLKSVMLQLSEEQLDQLDREARQSGASRSKVVRDAVDAHFRSEPDASIAARYEAAYPAARAGVDKWGDLDTWHDAAGHARGDAERGAW